jgi:inner membrane protein
MKWVSHKILTGAVGTGKNIPSLIAAAGSILPDALEGFSDASDQQRHQLWQARHRRLSHWFIPYLVILAVLYPESRHCGISELSFSDIAQLFRHMDFTTYQMYGYAGAYLALGALFHIAEDAICGKVPSLMPKGRIGIKLFYVGSRTEYFAVLALTCIVLAAKGII